MNTIEYMVAYVVISLTVGLLFLSFAHAQFLDFGKALQRETIEKILNYCFEHADRPNPVQDLLDKGLIDAEFSGETCESIKVTYDMILDYLGRPK